MDLQEYNIRTRKIVRPHTTVEKKKQQKTKTFCHTGYLVHAFVVEANG